MYHIDSDIYWFILVFVCIALSEMTYYI